MKQIYLDHASTTKIDPAVLKRMSFVAKRVFGNPSSLHSAGREARDVLADSRRRVAHILGASAGEVIFTGSGTESDNLALCGVARGNRDKGKHIIISKIEHKAVLETAEKLEKEGFDVTYLNVDSEGILNLDELNSELRADTVLVSVMYANNEIGTIQPVKEISKIIATFRKSNQFPLLHTDACHAAGSLPINIRKLGADLLTLNGSKVYGPKGVGCLYVRSGVTLDPLIIGGEQENNMRAGTENISLIAGFAEALWIAENKRIRESSRLQKLRGYFLSRIVKLVPHTRLNGHNKKRLPGNVNLSFDGIEGEALVLLLDRHGICASTGSACTSMNLAPSHVLLALYPDPERAHGSLRLSMGRETTKKELDKVLAILPRLVESLRLMSPIAP